MPMINSFHRAGAGEGVVLGVMHPGNVYATFFHAALRLTAVDDRVTGIISAEGKKGSASRCDIVRSFLENDLGDWLLFIDADMAFPPDLVELLLETANVPDKPLVSALFFCQFNNVYDRSNSVGGLYPGFTPYLEDGNPVADPYFDIPEEPFEVESAGGGCFLAHRSVYETLEKTIDTPQPWFDEVEIDGHVLPYDQAFFRRAKAAGFRVLVDPRTRLEHYNTYALTRPLWEQWKVVALKERREHGDYRGYRR